MKKRQILFGGILLVGTLAHAQLIDRPAAVVTLEETTAISQRELRSQVEQVEQVTGQRLTIAQRREVLNSQIDSELILQAAAREGLTATDQEIAQRVGQNLIAAQQQLGQQISEAQFRSLVEEQTGLTWEAYREQLRETLLQEKYVLSERGQLFQSIPAPSEAEIRAVYEENQTSFASPALVRFTHLFIDTRQLSGTELAQARNLAEDLQSRVRGRGIPAFNELVGESFGDDRFQGGDFGWLLRNDSDRLRILGQDFVRQVFALNTGQISRVLESNLGLHIVHVTNRREATVVGLDDPLFPGEPVTPRQQILQALQEQQQTQALSQAVTELVDELRAEAEVTVFEESLNW